MPRKNSKSVPVVVLINCKQSVVKRFKDPFIKLLFGVGAETVSINIDEEDYNEIFDAYNSRQCAAPAKECRDYLLDAYKQAVPHTIGRKRVQIVMVETATRSLYETVTDLFPKADMRWTSGKKVYFAPREELYYSGVDAWAH